MNDIIRVDLDKCVGCNKCIRVCPVSFANRAKHSNGLSKVEIIPEFCIHCGECIKACKHGARYFVDDLEMLMDDLRMGKNISVVIAPALRTSFKNNYKNLVGFFKYLGVNKVYDTSFGADITTWAYLKAAKDYNLSGIISQPCPAIVNFIEKYKPELLKKLAPVHSPMSCAAIYLHKYEKNNDALAFITPCIAKHDEANDDNTPDYIKYNVTFAKIIDMINDNKINLEDYPATEFDNPEHGLGSIYPMPGGLKENVLCHVPDAVVKQSEGPSEVYDFLSEFVDEMDSKNLPLLLDVLNCKHGCNRGTGVKNVTEKDVDFVMNKQIAKEKPKFKNQSFGPFKSKNNNKLFDMFDKELDLDDFKREYTSKKVEIKELAADELRNILGQMKKFTEAEQNFDCSACGYETCKEMAKAIGNKINVPQNCVMYGKSQLQEIKNIMEARGEALIEIIKEQSDNSLEIAKTIEDFSGMVDENLKSLDEGSHMISETANKARIVSMNAGIEAARLGEAGKTFEVVAKEVEVLATQSNDIAVHTNGINERLVKACEDINVANENIKTSTSALDEKIKRISEDFDEKIKVIEEE